MAEHSSIEWTDATWNPITGCSVVSPGCTNCYAMKLAGTRLKHHPSREGLTRDTKAGPVWTGETRFNQQWLRQPIDWKHPRRIFVVAHGDLFADGVEDEWLLDIFTVMAISGHHTFQVLTKRPDSARRFMNRPGLLEDIYANWYSFSGGAREVQSWPLHNVWLGTSVEDQRRADERIPQLLATQAAVRWISAEPLLGPIDLSNMCDGLKFYNPLSGARWHDAPEPFVGASDLKGGRLDWVVAGGESGVGARPSNPQWFRDLRDQCAAAGVPFHFKQWGAHITIGQADTATDYAIQNGPVSGDYSRGSPIRVGKKAAGRLLDGVLHDGFPS